MLEGGYKLRCQTTFMFMSLKINQIHVGIFCLENIFPGMQRSGYLFLIA